MPPSISIAADREARRYRTSPARPCRHDPGRPPRILVDGHVRRHEQDLVKIERVARLLGDGQMREMDGIEDTAKDAPAVSRSRLSSSHSSSTAPMRTLSPAITPARTSSRSTPSRARSRWKRSADLGCRSSSAPRAARFADRRRGRPRLRAERRRRRAPTRSDGRQRPPIGRLRELIGVGQQLGERGDEIVDAGPLSAEMAKTGTPSCARACSKAVRFSRASGRSILLATTSVTFSISSGSYSSSSPRMTW